ncbi:MAG TPA: hypothetical protein VH391_10475 [Solirubrobacterales bacterium]
MSARAIYAQTLVKFRREAGFLFLLGVLVFVPIGLLSALADRAGEIHVSHLSELVSLETGALVVGFVVQATTSLLGEVFYSGAVALTLAREERGGRPRLLEIARSLSYGRLIAVDILFGIAVAIGLLLFVVPGVVAFTWFALAGPLVEIEDDTVRSSFARSRRLVRGRFWTVLAVLVPITLASELITNAALTLSHGTFASPLLGDWVGESVTSIALSPFYAVAAVLITLHLTRAGSSGGEPQPVGAPG